MKCLGLQEDGCKNVVKLSEVLSTDVHWRGKTTGPDTYIEPQRGLFSFDHYRGEGGQFRFDPVANFAADEVERPEFLDVPPAVLE